MAAAPEPSDAAAADQDQPAAAREQTAAAVLQSDRDERCPLLAQHAAALPQLCHHHCTCSLKLFCDCMFDVLRGVLQVAERCRRQDGTEAQLVGRVPAQAARSRCLTGEHAAATVGTVQHYHKRATWLERQN